MPAIDVYAVTLRTVLNHEEVEDDDASPEVDVDARRRGTFAIRVRQCVTARRAARLENIMMGDGERKWSSENKVCEGNVLKLRVLRCVMIAFCGWCMMPARKQVAV